MEDKYKYLWDTFKEMNQIVEGEMKTSNIVKMMEQMEKDWIVEDLGDE